MNLKKKPTCVLQCAQGGEKKDKNARVAGRRTQTKERVAEQVCRDNIPMDLNESGDSSVSDSTEESL